MEFIAANFAPVMFAGLILFLLLGFPVAFSLGAAGQSVTMTAVVGAIAGPAVVVGTSRFDRRLCLAIGALIYVDVSLFSTEIKPGLYEMVGITTLTALASAILTFGVVHGAREATGDGRDDYRGCDRDGGRHAGARRSLAAAGRRI